ncbi:PAS domain S-box-containing protein [Halanaerobium saccharolyticum]|uniref:PAS domain S-box-containing protein n=1 Tax=Halanaerobium saccharolyticum TaxID=43595 RepID=A0A4R7YZN6_9FIRM|nr:HD domain-containing phosphohydrolase [Halanaerobium saccharolyticum]RAK07487.1 PAS domain S-box-containing protein [Halanaerobium saccharolyticum]TDW03064.1 PAS domain S-box-containing protein [Halanaerobium saccharolyticum]TDX59360.1 PAS domain S-box-containing protein [Halanaerobium saccharolyticum]
MLNFLKEEKKIIIIYLIVGFAWIYFSDRILLTVVNDVETFNRLQTFKGAFYVLFTAVLLFILIKRHVDSLKESKEEVYALNEQLTAYNEELLAMNEELDQSLDELNELNERFISMINMVSDLGEENKTNEMEFLSNLLKSAVKIVPEADYGKIYLIKGDICNFIDAIGHDIEILKNIKIDKSNLLNYNKSEAFTSQDCLINMEGISTETEQKLAKALKPIKKSLNINIMTNQTLRGRISLDIAADSSREFRDTTKKVMESFATLASTFFAFKHYEDLQGRFTRELISAIIKILEIYDPYTRGHSENVAELASAIAEKMGLSRKLITDTYWAGMVHDIGKLLVPVNILNKKGKLNNTEYEIIKNHPVWGSEALSNSASLKHISEYILYHHERWDGKGYPEGLKNEQIPLVAQILSVADSWDAMRSERSYRNPLSQKKALLEIKNNKKSQFAPEVVDAFLELLKNNNLDQENQQNNREKIFLSNVDENYFEQLFDQSAEGIVILDNNFRVVKSNQHFLEMFGYQRNEILNKQIKEIVVPAEKSSETDNFMEMVENGERVNARSFRHKKNGEKIEVSIQGFPISLNRGDYGYYIIYQDITEFKNLERKYISSRGKYRALFENEEVVMLIIDPADGQIIDANPAAENFYGWNREKLISMKISEINILDQEEVKKEMQQAREKNRNHFNFKHRTANDKIKDVEVYSQPIPFAKKEYLYSIIHEKSKVMAESF